MAPTSKLERRSKARSVSSRLYFEHTGHGWQHHLSECWGRCRRIVEVLDDDRAGRQIEIYVNGVALKYDRAHESDEYGRLVGHRFSRKEKWRKFFEGARIMTQDEFEERWRRFGRTVQANAK